MWENIRPFQKKAVTLHPEISNKQGKVLEWLKRHAWKACDRQNRFVGSNPILSANEKVLFGWPSKTFFASCFVSCAIAEGVVGDAEEERQHIGGYNQEYAGTNDYHDLLLENLLISCKCLIINYYLSSKNAKRTNKEQRNWKQKKENAT